MWDFLALRHQLKNAENKPTVVHSTRAGEPGPDVSVSAHGMSSVLSVVPEEPDEVSDPGASISLGELHWIQGKFIPPPQQLPP